MSTAPQPVNPSLGMIERRLYPRIVPRNPIYLTLNGTNPSLLLNISENGLLVSSPVQLPGKFAALIAIPLHGQLQPLLVKIRVVWTSESRMLAGIRLVDLTEYEREQIRKWSAQGCEIFGGFVGSIHPANAKPVQETQLGSSPETDTGYESLRGKALEAPSEPPSDGAGGAMRVKTALLIAALLSLMGTLWLAPKVYLVREILALLGILAVIALIGVSFLLLAMFLWEGTKRGFSLIQSRRTVRAAETPLQEILAEIPECAVSPDLLRNP